MYPKWNGGFGVLACFVVFTFNNPYSGFGLGLIVLLTAFVMLVKVRQINRYWMYIASVGLSPLLCLFVYLHFLIPFTIA